jgi:hypothetical protein
MEENKMKIIKVIFIMCVVISVAGISFAQEMTKRTAKIAEVQGVVEVKTASGDVVPAKVGMVLNEGDAVYTKSSSSALLNVDGSAETATVEVKSNAKMKLSELLENKKEGVQMTLLDLSMGEILIKAKKLHSESSRFEVKTPTSIVGVKGTTFSVTVEAVEK